MIKYSNDIPANDEFNKLYTNIRPEIRKGKTCEHLKAAFKEHSGAAEYFHSRKFMNEAAEYNNIEALQAFLDAGFHPDSVSLWLGERETPLGDAIRGRAYKAVEFLLDAGADVNNTFDGTSPSPLVWAASRNDLKMVKILIERGADIHATYARYGKERFNALKWAILDGSKEVEEYLRSLGAVLPEEITGSVAKPANEQLKDWNVNFRSNTRIQQSDTAQESDEDMLENNEEFNKLLPAIWDEIQKEKTCKKLKAAVKAHRRFAEYVFCREFMHHAAARGHIEALKVFLDAGFHPDTICPWCGKWHSPFVETVCAGAYKAVEFLLDAGADVNNTYGIDANNPSDGAGATPLAWASLAGNLNMVKMLIERGADVHTTFINFGERSNALEWAVSKKHKEIEDYLRSLGAVLVKNKKVSLPEPVDEQLKDLSVYFHGKPLPQGLTQIVQASVPMMVHIFPPVEGKRKNTVFVTSDLIEYALIVPQGQEEYMFAEYFLEMPGWPITDEALKQEEYFWPIRWLMAIGRYPHENETYYGEEATITSEMIPELKTPDGRYNSAKVERVPALNMVMSKDGRSMVYYRVTPLCVPDISEHEPAKQMTQPPKNKK